MLPKNTIFKSFYSLSVLTFGDITYVMPGWHAVPKGTTIKEANKYWVEEKIPSEPKITPEHEVSETVISKRTGEEYTVTFRDYWSCTCLGYSFRRTCKHIEQIKQKYIK